MNVKLLRRIKKHILEEPKRLVMEDLIRRGNPGDVFESDNGVNQEYPECGTAACIAGWAFLLSGTRIEGGSYIYRASFLLDISSRTCDRVFLATAWPSPFKEQYKYALRPSERAKIAAARIDHLIKTGE